MMALMDAGIRIPMDTSALVAANAKPPSRKVLGAARIASSQRDVIIGSTMKPRTIAALAALKTSVDGNMAWRKGVTVVTAK